MASRKIQSKSKAVKSLPAKPTLGTACDTDGGSNMEEQLIYAIGNEVVNDVKYENKVRRLLDVLGRSTLQELRMLKGELILNYAILKRNFFIARLLIEKGVNHLLRDQSGQTAVHAAAAVDNTSLLLTMLSGGDVNVQDDRGETPLHVAVRNCSMEAVKFLVFAGADPFINNKKGEACRMLATKHQVQLILRDYTPQRRRKKFTVDDQQPFTADDLHFSMQLTTSVSKVKNMMTSKEVKDTATSTQKRGVLYSALEPEDLGGGLLTEDEEVVGKPVDYWIAEAASMSLVFPLYDFLDKWMELVLRLIFDNGERTDVKLDVSEGPPSSSPTPEKQATYNRSGRSDEELPTKLPGNDLCRIVCHAQTTVLLQPAGLIILILRPLQEPVSIKEGQTEVTSVVDDHIKLKAPENFRGNVNGHLQIERAFPVHEKPSMAAGPHQPQPVVEKDIESQGDYIKFTRKLSNEDLSGQLTLEVPIPKEYTGGFLVVYVRRTSQDSETSEADSEADDDDREARRWTRQEVDAHRMSGSIQMPLVANKTVTVIETKSGVPEEKVRKKIANQYKKRRYKRAVFFVIARPWSGWRECREIVVVVTSPRQLLTEQKKHVRDGYSLVQLTGEHRTPSTTPFRASVVGDLFVESGPGEATLNFRTGPATEDNYCKFIVRGRVTGKIQGGIFIEREKMAKKRGTDQNSFADSRWKAVGQIRFDVSHLAASLQHLHSGKDVTWPFTDAFLMELASNLAPSEAGQLGIRLGMSHSQVDGVLSNLHIFSPTFRCFEIIRLQRDRCDTPLTFGQCLVKALTSMGWNLQCEWLFQQLNGWDRINELKGKAVFQH